MFEVRTARDSLMDHAPTARLLVIPLPEGLHFGAHRADGLQSPRWAAPILELYIGNLARNGTRKATKA